MSENYLWAQLHHYHQEVPIPTWLNSVYVRLYEHFLAPKGHRPPEHLFEFLLASMYACGDAVEQSIFLNVWLVNENPFLMAVEETNPESITEKL